MADDDDRTDPCADDDLIDDDGDDLPPCVIVESPYAATTPEQRRAFDDYLSRALADSLARGEAPYASHGLYTRPGVLDDDVPEQRRQGIEAGHAWLTLADKVAMYVDYGESSGMRQAREFAAKWSVPVEERRIGVEQ